MLEQLSLGLQVMILGLAAVFIGLFFLVVLIELLNKIIGSRSENKNKQFSTKDKAVNKPESMGENLPTSESPIMIDEDEELIAVISAAVAATLNRSTHDIIVKSVKRIEHHSPVWNRIGRQEQVESRL